MLLSYCINFMTRGPYSVCRILFSVPNTLYDLVEELPENWNDAQDIKSLRALDRSFVFPGNCFLNLPFSFGLKLN